MPCVCMYFFLVCVYLCVCVCVCVCVRTCYVYLSCYVYIYEYVFICIFSAYECLTFWWCLCCMTDHLPHLPARWRRQVALICTCYLVAAFYLLGKVTEALLSELPNVAPELLVSGTWSDRYEAGKSVRARDGEEGGGTVVKGERRKTMTSKKRAGGNCKALTRCVDL